ncbi:hypothetical protein GWI33_020197 [Rhynchophorus ferrugineus]|uniref:Uncharacterized protein n=1 Tax=Rhynchophorus ferrugineus TaxID=354439 RepID=A0A834LZP7_RHYFE|nr:hypothetical protein GWI33_020197 [Rhynchophorus ferrugineus]
MFFQGFTLHIYYELGYILEKHILFPQLIQLRVTLDNKFGKTIALANVISNCDFCSALGCVWNKKYPM